MRSKGRARERSAGAKQRARQVPPTTAAWARDCAAAFRARRRALRLTQAELAQLAGVGLAFLYELEQGKPTVRMDKLLDVARVLGLELRLASGKRGFALDAALSAERES